MRELTLISKARWTTCESINFHSANFDVFGREANNYSRVEMPWTGFNHIYVWQVTKQTVYGQAEVLTDA